MRFLSYNLSLQPLYTTVLELIRFDAKFLDAERCIMQKVRYFFQDAVPPSQHYGFDLEPEFIDLRYRLFCDRDKLQATSVSRSIVTESTTPEGQELVRLQGHLHIIFASSILHVWTWDDMIKATKSLVSMTRPCQGPMIMGNNLGSLKAGQYKMPTSR